MIQYFGTIERDFGFSCTCPFSRGTIFFFLIHRRIYIYIYIIALQRIFVKKTNFTSSFHDCDCEAMDTQTT